MRLHDDNLFLQNSIQDGLNNIYSLFVQMQLLQEYSGGYENYEYESIKDDFESLAKSTYLQILVYIEYNGLHSYLNEFKIAFESKFKTRDIFEQYFHPDSGEVYSQLYIDFWQYLKPFNFKEPDDFESIYQKKGLLFLERILENSDRIIKLNNVEIKQESNIYNTIKPYITILFPDMISADGQYIFNRLGKYKPDILIPELHVAVEYKFINTVTDIKSTISEIADDVIGYKDKIGTNQYKLFYCVYYIINSGLTKERFNELWKERNYPIEWRPIAVFERT